MIDHMGFAVGDIGRSRAFYEAALRLLGLAVLMEATPEQTASGGTAIGFGEEGGTRTSGSATVSGSARAFTSRSASTIA